MVNALSRRAKGPDLAAAIPVCLAPEVR
jgi:hypothetical protein